MALALDRLHGDDVVRVPFLNGFCYVVRRAVIDAIGYLDEDTFAEGYSEENDYSRRAATAGYDLVVACGAYVRHAKSRSYGADERSRLAKEQYQKFLAKHGEAEIRELVEALDRDPQLRTVRDRVARATSSPRELVDVLPRLRVTFVLPGLADGGSGGSHSIFQEAAALRRLGLEARIALPKQALGRAREAYSESNGLFTAYAGTDDLVDGAGPDNIIVATHWRSVEPVLEVIRHAPETIAAYYVQDYEPLFSRRDSSEERASRETYELMADHVVFAKTDWLCDLVAARHGVRVQRVEPSIDHDIFHPRGREEPAVARVAAMVRPRTPRRGAAATVDLMRRLQARFGHAVELTTFGCPTDALKPFGGVPDGVVHQPVLSRARVADLLRATDVFIDCSWYQAFGRTALEAMACGATAVTPRIGGAGSFAIDGTNGRLVDTLDPDEVEDAVAALILDRRTRIEMQRAAVGAAARYSSERAALSEYVLFTAEWLRRRRVPDGAMS